MLLTALNSSLCLHFYSLVTGCPAWAEPMKLRCQRLLNTCNLGTQARVRGPNIQQRQKLNTSCLPDYSSSAVVEGSWRFFKFKEEQIFRAERDRNQFQSVIATERSLYEPHWSLFLYICISLHVVVVTESANHIKTKLQLELGLNEKCIITLKSTSYGYEILFRLNR